MSFSITWRWCLRKEIYKMCYGMTKPAARYICRRNCFAEVQGILSAKEPEFHFTPERADGGSTYHCGVVLHLMKNIQHIRLK